MFIRRKVLFFLLLLVMVVSACSANTQTPTAQPGGADPNVQTPAGGTGIDENAPAVVAAKTALSQQTGISQDQISFVSAEAVEWSDSCLGLGGPAESCLQAITPGYNIMLSAQGTNYEVHTDETGNAVRIKQ